MATETLRGLFAFASQATQESHSSRQPRGPVPLL